MDSLDLRVLGDALDWHRTGHAVTLVTVVQTWGSAPRPPGALLAVRDDGRVSGSVSGGCVEEDLIARTKAAFGALNLWRLADRYHRRLDRQRTAATHGVEERLGASVASQPQDGGSERFFQRGRVSRFAITALMQRLTRRVQAKCATPVIEMRHHHHFRIVAVHGGHSTTSRGKAFANGLAHLRDDLQRWHGRVASFSAECFHHEATRGVEQFGPMNAARLRTQHGRRLRRNLAQHTQYTARRRELQVNFVSQPRTCAELHGAIDGLQVHGPESLEFRNQRRLGFFGAGSNETLQSVRGRTHSSTSKTFSTAPSAGEVIWPVRSNDNLRSKDMEASLSSEVTAASRDMPKSSRACESVARAASKA